MNITYYSHYFSPEIGAPSARIYDLSQQWLHANHHVSVVTCFPNHPTGQLYPGYTLSRYMYENIDDIHVHRNWSYITANKGFIKKTLGHISFWLSAALSSKKQVANTDVVIGTSPTFFAAMGAIGLAQKEKIPFIMEVRDLWPAIFVELGVLKNRQIIAMLERWEMWMYKRATKIVTVTNAFRENLIARGIPAEKIYTIPNGADINYWQPSPASPTLRQKLNLTDRFVVLYIGAHGISQALSHILDSAALLQTTPNIQFLFVGAGAEKEMLIQRTQQLGLSNVTFHDSVTKEEVKDFYALADVCLIPLRDIPLFDTFIPSKMFEIMSMARPIIGSVRGEPANILQASGGALVVPPEDSQAIADAILALYQQPNLCEDLGQNGRKYVSNHYSRQQLALKYIDVLESAVTQMKK
ncbi:MAG: glycosyltransferase family 4 protein [Anaerolineales bacterium]|nr:glycosyltransferase family 4 protein [Anaerolineales bacterium]